MPLSFKFMILGLLAMLTAFPAQAQNPAYYGYLNTLTTINNYSPDKSPRHESVQEIVTDRIVDSKNEVIGEVRDVILNDQGRIESLDVELDRLKIGSDRLTLDYALMRFEPTGNGYKTGFTKEQVIEMFPALLNQIPTAAGLDASAPMSMLALQGAPVWSGDKKIGTVKDVLFNELGGHAELLFIELARGGYSKKPVAVPYNDATFERENNRIKIRVNEELALAIKEVADQ